MNCPFCSSPVSKVVDKRAVLSLGEIRRRRECLKCAKRFTTYERVASLELVIVKKDGRHEPFAREKLRKGIILALEKRPGLEKAEDLVERIERKLRKKGKKEVASKIVGQLVLTELKKLDTIAYLRFASVYRQFSNPEDFARELTSLGNNKH